MTDLMSLVYKNRTDVKENMKDVLDFETKIAQVIAIVYFISIQLYFAPFHPFHFTSPYSTPLLFTPLHFTPFHSTPLHFTSLHFTSLRFASLRFTSLHFTSLHFTPSYSTELLFTSTFPLHSTLLHFTSLRSHYYPFTWLLADAIPSWSNKE